MTNGVWCQLLLSRQTSPQKGTPSEWRLPLKKQVVKTIQQGFHTPEEQVYESVISTQTAVHISALSHQLRCLSAWKWRTKWSCSPLGRDIKVLDGQEMEAGRERTVVVDICERHDKVSHHRSEGSASIHWTRLRLRTSNPTRSTTS